MSQPRFGLPPSVLGFREIQAELGRRFRVLLLCVGLSLSVNEARAQVAPYPQPQAPPEPQPAPEQYPLPPPRQQPYPPSPGYPAAQPPARGYPPPNSAPAYPPPEAEPGQDSYPATADGYPKPQYPPEEPSEAENDTSDAPFEMPTLSVRVDPFNWLLHGRLGIEIESELWKFVSVELVPIFVVDESPPAFNLRGRESNVTQESDGIGTLSGASLGVGFWLNGTPFRGYVLRAFFTNYGYSYLSQDGSGQIDEASHTERHFYGYFGSHGRWGPFTIAGGIGLGVELNKERRCFAAAEVRSATSSCNDEVLLLALNRSATQHVDLNGALYPIQLIGRFSLGLVF